MREVTVIQRHCAGSEQVQELLASCLDFPAYYGGNFAALDDCLGDIDEPTRIVIDRRRVTNHDQDAWFDRLCTVIARASQENELLDMVIRYK